MALSMTFICALALPRQRSRQGRYPSQRTCLSVVKEERQKKAFCLPPTTHHHSFRHIQSMNKPYSLFLIIKGRVFP